MCEMIRLSLCKCQSADHNKVVTSSNSAFGAVSAQGLRPNCTVIDGHSSHAIAGHSLTH